MSQGEDREGQGIEQSLSDAAAPNGIGTGSERVQQDQGPNEGRPTFGSRVHLSSESPLRQLGRSIDELTRAVSHAESLVPSHNNVERAQRTLSGDRGGGVVSGEGPSSVRVASARGAAGSAGRSIDPRTWEDPYPSEERFNTWLPLDGEGPFLRPPLAVPLSLLREQQRSDDRANATNDLVQQALEEATRVRRIPGLGDVGGSVPLGGVSDVGREVRRVMMEAVMEHFRATREMQRRAEESIDIDEIRRRLYRYARVRREQRRDAQQLRELQRAQTMAVEEGRTVLQQQQQPPSQQPRPQGSQQQPQQQQRQQQQQEVPPESLSQQPRLRPQRSPLVLQRLGEITDDLTNLDRRLRSLGLVPRARPTRLDDQLNAESPRASVADAGYTTDENIHAGDADAAATGAAPLPPLSEEDISAMPPSFLCPVSLAPMTDPILCSDGHSYDRASIMQHVRSRRGGGLPLTSPLTNQAMGRDMWMNHTLKKAIHEWVEARRSQQQSAGDEDMQTLKAEHDSLLERFQELEDDYDALHAEHESHVQTSQQQHHQLNHRYQTLRAQHNQLKQDHEDLRKQLNKQRDQHKTQFTQLQTRHTALQQRHEKMSRRYKAEEDRLRLESAVDRRMWIEREERMKGEYAELYAEFEALQAQAVDGDHQQLEEVEQKQESLTRSPSPLQQPQHSDAEYEKLHQDHQSLLAEHQELHERYKSLESAHKEVTASGNGEQPLPAMGPGITDDGSDEVMGGAIGEGSGGGDDDDGCGTGDYQPPRTQTQSKVQSQQDPTKEQQHQQQQTHAQQEKKEDVEHHGRHTPPHRQSLDELIRQALEPRPQPQPQKRPARQHKRRPPTPKRPAKTTSGNKISNSSSSSTPSSLPPPSPGTPPPPVSPPPPSTQPPAVTPATVALAAAPLIGGLLLTRYLG